MPMRMVSSAAAAPASAARQSAPARIERNTVMGANLPVMSPHLPAIGSDASAFGAAPDEIAPLAIAVEGLPRAQSFQRPHDFAAVTAAHCGHELFEILRP